MILRGTLISSARNLRDRGLSHETGGHQEGECLALGARGCQSPAPSGPRPSGALHLPGACICPPSRGRSCSQLALECFLPAGHCSRCFLQVPCFPVVVARAYHLTRNLCPCCSPKMPVVFVFAYSSRCFCITLAGWKAPAIILL